MLTKISLRNFKKLYVASKKYFRMIIVMTHDVSNDVGWCNRLE